MAPDLLVRHYDWAGFDVLAVTDHWVRTAEPSTSGLLVIPGAELNAQAGGPEHDAHVLALGVEADPQLPGDEFASLAEVAAPLLEPDANEREGYVPNVVYSCGGLVHGRDLVIPYAMSDYASTFATVPLDDVLNAMTRG